MKLYHVYDKDDRQVSYICSACIQWIRQNRPDIFFNMIVEYRGGKAIEGECNCFCHNRMVASNQFFTDLIDNLFDKLRGDLGRPLTAHEKEFMVTYFKLQAERHLVGYEGM